jgi:acetylornithine deacetylase/succinyl-diaminopimelate desuccinylase-like protein
MRHLIGLTLGLFLSLTVCPPVAIAQPGKDDRVIAQAVALPKVRAAFAAIDADAPRGLREMVELTEIPAPPFGEEKRAARFAEMLRDSGLSDVSIDKEGNVIARRPGRGGGPTVALIAHLDTVFPIETDVTVKVSGNTYSAPGIGDNSRGLVYVLSLARAMQSARLETRGDVLFVGSVGEEGLGDLRGVRHLFRQGGPKIDVALVVDGGDITRVVNAGVGSLRYRLTVSGPGGHSYGAFGLANPHHAMARILAHFDAAAEPLTIGLPKATYNVGRMGGGTSVNTIPTESWAEIDLRSSDAARLQALDAALSKAIATGLEEENAQRRAEPGLTVEKKSVGQRPGGAMADDAPLALSARAAFKHFGVTPMFEPSSTDANVPLSLGIPALTLSRGGISGRAHAPDEFWQNVDAERAVKIGLLITVVQAGIAR